MSNSVANVDFAEIIRAAATSPLGVLSLLCLILAFLAYNFFRRAQERTRVIMFLIILSIVVFASAIGFAVSSIPPEDQVKLDPIEVIQSRLPVEQGVISTSKEIGGQLVISEITRTALGLKLDVFFTPVGYDSETQRFEIGQREKNLRLPSKEMRRIYVEWTCRQKELRSLLGDAGEVDVEIFIMGIWTRIYSKFQCDSVLSPALK